MSVKNTLEFFKIAKPNPNPKDFFLQTAYNFEEWSEVVDAIGMKDTSLFEEVEGAKDALIYLATGEYSNECDRIYLEKVDRLALADGIADSIVTLIGMAHLAGINIESAFAEVSASNLSKFIKVSGGINTRTTCTVCRRV